jgi:hypothetical protein
MKRWLFYLAAAWTFFALTWWICGRLLMTDEKRVLLQIETLSRLVESGNLLSLDNAITAGYRDDWDNDKRTLMLAVRALRQQYRDIEIHRGRAVVRIAGDTATADFRAHVTGRATNDTRIEGERGDYRLAFRHIERDWKLSGVTRKEPAP